MILSKNYESMLIEKYTKEITSQDFSAILAEIKNILNDGNWFQSPIKFDINKKKEAIEFKYKYFGEGEFIIRIFFQADRIQFISTYLDNVLFHYSTDIQLDNEEDFIKELRKLKGKILNVSNKLKKKVLKEK